jgi:opacity protein-like surface antigen
MDLQRVFRAASSGISLLAAGLFSAAACAEDEPGGWYVGGAMDNTHVEVLRGDWGYDVGGSQRGFSVRGALQFNRSFELELGTMSASDVNWTEYFVSYENALTAHTTFDVKAVNLSAVGKYGGEWFEGYLKIGVAQYDLDGRQVLDTLMTDAVATRDVHASGLDYLVGAGFFVKPTPRWRVRVEYQYFGVDRDFLGISSGDDPTVDTFSIGFDYRLTKPSTSESSSQ